MTVRIAIINNSFSNCKVIVSTWRPRLNNPNPNPNPNMTGCMRHTCVIFLLFCTSGFPLLSLNHGCYGHECSMDAFHCNIRCLWRKFLPNNSALPAIFITCHSNQFTRRKTKGYTYSQLPYYGNHVSTFNIKCIC